MAEVEAGSGNTDGTGIDLEAVIDTDIARGVEKDRGIDEETMIARVGEIEAGAQTAEIVERDEAEAQSGVDLGRMVNGI
jgi:hypothetical protein